MAREGGRSIAGLEARVLLTGMTSSVSCGTNLCRVYLHRRHHTFSQATMSSKAPGHVYRDYKLEVKLGIGGTSYADFIQSLHLPSQLSQVDPIVASFSGGAVGVISCLMLIEASNVRLQQKKRCKYCLGTGYFACARCAASGVVLSTKPISLLLIDTDQPPRLPTTARFTNYYEAGKVMCPVCLCTGLVMASEHDPRIDPFD